MKQPSVEFDKPTVVTEVDRQLLEAIREGVFATSKERNVGDELLIRWSADGGRRVPGFARPLIELVSESVQKYGRRAPWKIEIDIDCGDAVPGNPQRHMSSTWHFDVPLLREPLSRLVVADRLPTEVLWTPHLSNGEADQIVRGRFLGGELEADQAELEELGFEVFVPEAYQMVDLGNRLHRSPLNRTSEIIRRTWIRGKILE